MRDAPAALSFPPLPLPRPASRWCGEPRRYALTKTRVKQSHTHTPIHIHTHTYMHIGGTRASLSSATHYLFSPIIFTGQHMAPHRRLHPPQKATKKTTAIHPPSPHCCVSVRSATTTTLKQTEKQSQRNPHLQYFHARKKKRRQQ
jgi:hypothetical protein